MHNGGGGWLRPNATSHFWTIQELLISGVLVYKGDMETIEQNELPISEALKLAHESWLPYYSGVQNASPGNFLHYRPSSLFFDRLILSAGSIINLLPNTHYEVDDFRCWRTSVDEAWDDDWYNIGADLYGALSNTQLELFDVQPAEHKPADSTTC